MIFTIQNLMITVCLSMVAMVTTVEARPQPMITITQASASADLTQLSIIGAGFSGVPDTVTLSSGSGLSIVSTTDTLLIASLPPSIAPGSYLLTVSGGSRSATFTVTIGAVGPVGPIGVAGAIGPQGPAGVQGTQGPQGNAGPQGAIGSQGATGATGAIGPQGPAGSVGAMGPIGPIGPTGPQGAAGSQGATGATGAVGTTGPSMVYQSALASPVSVAAFNGNGYAPGVSDFTLIAKLTLPDGSYLLQGMVSMINVSADGLAGQCAIFINGNPYSVAWTGYITLRKNQYFGGDGGETGVYSIHGAAWAGMAQWPTGYGGLAELRCVSSTDSQIQNAVITATLTGAVVVQ